MIYTITIILSILVLANFLLLKFSCNKTRKPVKQEKETMVINRPIAEDHLASQQQLAATGS